MQAQPNGTGNPFLKKRKREGVGGGREGETEKGMREREWEREIKGESG